MIETLVSVELTALVVNEFEIERIKWQKDEWGDEWRILKKPLKIPPSQDKAVIKNDPFIFLRLYFDGFHTSEWLVCFSYVWE